MNYRLGIDAGSTTVKIVVLDNGGQMVYHSYNRHKADVGKTLQGELANLARLFPDAAFSVCISGSAGMGIAERTGFRFVQEVLASVKATRQEFPQCGTIIDLGGEDAKMVFLDARRQPDIRMNGNCAGGTGAFIDQMADLLAIPVERLGEVATRYRKIYPVASRCGVFAKTDVQNLLSRGVPVEDIAMSVLHTVALQCITSLARGYDILPSVLCIGGPLTFIPALRDAFRQVAGLSEGDMIVPVNGELFPAWGAALSAGDSGDKMVSAAELLEGFEGRQTGTEAGDVCPPLFRDAADYDQWRAGRNEIKLPVYRPAAGEHVRCFLGIDSGSTTTKIVVLDEHKRLVYSFYDRNEGNPLKKATEGVMGFYHHAATNGYTFSIVSSAATGYGEDLIRSAFGMDHGIVETMAHLAGAKFVDPSVSFILDIGGQDMKSIFVRNGVISNIELNEACSSGCGSFLQNFASTMNMTTEEFTVSACMARRPCDLGTRCTVFMNSKVKQALRENATFGDIAAGLAYSVVKNCLYKVLKITNLNQLGDNIVVQGGTFRNDAVFRALELLSGKKVSCTDNPELMGAFGAALYALEKFYRKDPVPERSVLNGDGITLPGPGTVNKRELSCKGCNNRCTVLRFTFDNGNICHAGNKCEKVFYNKALAPEKGYNAFDRKNEILFGDPCFTGKVTEKEAEFQPGVEPHIQQTGKKHRIGIPRALNMYENYPFWKALFDGCGIDTVLSPESTYELYQQGIGSVMSDNICFPAKLVHGHIAALAAMGVDRIFYPIIPKEHKEFDRSANSYNCPVVSGYPDVVRASMEPGSRFGIPLDKPVITFSDHRALKRACRNYLTRLGIDGKIFDKAFDHALSVRNETKLALTQEQRRLFDRAVQKGDLTFVVAGRPYHTDPLINQKIGQILSDLGAHAFTDDIFRDPMTGSGFGQLKIVSQWSYPNRVVQAAMEVAKLPPNVQLIQLNSFGCGPDSFFMDETGEILRQAGKPHTVVRIDEIASPGSVRLRLRSLIESLRHSGQPGENITPYAANRVAYTEKDKAKTILAPWFSDFISPFIPALGKLAGYNIVNLPRSDRQSAEAGLKYGHNEVCYPSTLVLGDIINALQSGKYDPEQTVVAITQTGGQCRATNYISQIKNGLESAGFPNVPMIALSTGKVYQNDQKAFRIPLLKLLNITVYSLLYADCLQQMFSAMTVRERTNGQAQALFDKYIARGVEAAGRNDHHALLLLLRHAVSEFNEMDITGKELTRVGLIGEIYVKYNNYGQANTTKWLRENGVDVHTPPIIDFLMQYFVNSEVNESNGVEKRSLLGKFIRPLFWKYMNERIGKVERIMERFRFYEPSESIYAKAEYAADILDLSNQFGEGWPLVAEIACYARNGINRIVCIQPFGCIANHIVAKGIEKRVRKFYPDVNLLYLDVDGGTAEVNIRNRLRFLI